MENVSNNKDQYQVAFENYQRIFSLSQDDLQKSILDVGAGSGKFIHYLRDSLGNKNAYGAEKSKFKIEPGEEGMVIANGFELPFSDESFELVLAKNYLPMFVEDEEKMHAALQELLRVTQHGGKVVGDISVPEGVTKDWEEYKTLEGYDKNTENWFVKRHEAAQKLLLYLDALKENGVNVEREGEIVTIHKS